MSLTNRSLLEGRKVGGRVGEREGGCRHNKML